MKVNFQHYCEKVDIYQNLIFFLLKTLNKQHHIQFIKGFWVGFGFSSFELDLASLNCTEYYCSLKAATVELLRLLAG